MATESTSEASRASTSAEAPGQAVLLDVLRGPLRDEVCHVDLLHSWVQLPEADETPGELPGSDDTDLHGVHSPFD